MGFWEWLTRDDLKIAMRDLRAGEEAGYIIARASSRNIQVECKVCKKEVSELAAVCPNCGEPMPGLRIQCPNCSSYHVTIQTKGFSVAQAAAGAIAVGALGLAAGMIGHKDNHLVCLGCNHKWRIEKSSRPIPKSRNSTSQARSSPRCHVCHKGGSRLVKTTKGQWICAKCIAKGVGGKPLHEFYPRVKKLKTPYQYLEDIGKYRCEYCVQIGKYHYYKTLKGIKGHIKEHPVHNQ